MSNTAQALEGLKVEPTTSIKLDTSLEHTLPKQSSESSNLSCSSSSVSIDDGSCHHKKILSQGNYDTCVSCGVYVPKNGVKNYKSNKGIYSTCFPPKTIYETMTRRSASFNQALNPEYIQVRQNYVEWILELAEKLRISPNSTHLGILLMDTIVFKDPSLTCKLQLFAPICLLVAAKTIELDERIPYIPKLRRYAGSTSFSVDDYTRAELHVLDLVDWNPQFSSPIELIEFFMCQGFLFSNDLIIDNIVEKTASPVQKTEEKTPTAAATVTQEVIPQVQAEEKAVEKKETEEATLTVTKENSEVTQATLTTMTEIEDQSAQTTTNTTQQEQQPAQTQEETTETTQSHDIIELPKQIGLGSGSLIVEDLSVAATPKSKKLSERKARTILAHFETSYTKILTYILRDVDFLEFEPKVIASAVLAFFRNINQVASWNDELDLITNLKFEQVSRCLELVQKKYTSAFDMKNAKPQNVLYDLHSNNSNNNTSIIRERIEPVQQPQPELKSRTNLINNGVPNKQIIEANFAPIDTKLAERKPTFTTSTYQPQPKNVTTTILPTAYNYIRDDLRLKTKTATGTFNSEIPMRNPMKSALHSGYQVGRTGLTQEQIPGMHTSVHAALGRNDFSALANHPGLGNDSYIKRDQYAMGGMISGHSQLTSENRLPYHMKGAIKK